MKTHTILAIAVLAASASTAAIAKSPDWDLVQVGYAQTDIDGFDEFSPAGFTLSGSTLVSENIFVLANYSLLSDDVLGVDLDLTQASIGFGYRHEMTASTDVYGSIAYEYVEADASLGGMSESADDDGYSLKVGVKSMLTENFEIDANLGYIGSDGEGDATFSVAGNYYFTQNVAVGLSYYLTDNLDTLGVSVRYAF